MRNQLFLLAAVLVASGCGTPPPPPAETIPTIGFEMYRDVIVVPVFIDDRGPFNMMLDTGTDPSAIDFDLANELGLKLSKESEPVVGGGSDSTESFSTSLPRLRVGGVEARDVEASTVDLSSIGKALSIRLDGVLGHSFLNGRVVQIDYPAKLLRFPKAVPPLSRDRSRRTTIKFRYADDSVLMDDVAVNGRKVATLFDTGFNGAFNLRPWAIPLLGLQRDFDAAKPKVSQGYKGRSTSREGTVGEVTIGNLEVTLPTVIFWEPGTGHDGTAYALTVGNRFLKDYVVTISYPDGVIALDK